MRKKEYESIGADGMTDEGIKIARGAAYPKKISTASGTDWFTTKEGKINGELENISKGACPFDFGNNGDISVRDTIELCQKAYWNVAIFRSTIDIQTEFSNAKLHFRSPNKRVSKFYEAWYKKINGWAFAEKFFLEWFRSGNVFIYKFNAQLDLSEYRKYTRAAKKNGDKIPLRYIILNPVDIKCLGASSFLNAKYGKVLNKYEADRLKKPKTEEEKEFFDTLPKSAQEALKKGTNPLIELAQEDLIAVFCAKQDYEALSVPMYYPVLADIDLKLEFKKAEKVLARTVDQAVLLMTAGDKENKPNQNMQILADLAELFSAESVGRVVISDQTTKGEWLIPDLNTVFGSEKYKTVNEDIASGLMNVFYGDEKFATTSTKIQVFLERLNHAREAYLNYFLKPEMQLIADVFNFQTIPEVEFEPINIKDELEYNKLYVRMAELGLMTPQETFEAVRTKQLPMIEDSVMNQEDHQKLKKKGLYEPIMGKPKEDNGRPKGAKAPQKTKKVAPIGASVDEKYSMSKITDNLKQFYSLLEDVETHYKQAKGMARLSKRHKEVCKMIAENIIVGNSKDNWRTQIDQYIANPFTPGDENYVDNTMTIAAEHGISTQLAAILYNSQIDNIPQDEPEV